MSNKEKILEYLDAFSSVNPAAVVSRLSRGFRLAKSLGQEYEIDNINLDDELGRFPVGAIPYNLVNKALRSEGPALRALFGEASCIPFSRVVKAGFGQCLEKAILLQLATQKAGISYLVSGALEEVDGGAMQHSFNLVARAESVYLVDAENPFQRDKAGNVLRPYVVHVNDISPSGAIIVDEACRAGRTYSLD